MSKAISSGPWAGVEANTTIELALVLTGTVSAGAYSAGVMDILMRALRRYSELSGAPHRVRVKALAGSSGGALTLFLAGLWAYQTRWSPLSQLTQNPLYHYWVERIDAEILLRLDDCQPQEHSVPLSLLNGQAITQLTHEALTRLMPNTQGIQPDWLHPDCRLFLTSTSFTGIPYQLGGSNSDLTMPYFGDVHRFALTPNLSSDDWHHMRDCAHASATFPLAFPPQALTHPKQDAMSLLPELVPDPHWLAAPPPNNSAWHIDGGVVNNSPVEYARQTLSGSPTACNPRFANQAKRITVLISPFNPTSNPIDSLNNGLTSSSGLDQLITQASRTVQVMLGQSRFKWDELRLACDSNTYSRFLIAPSRSTPLYSHLLGAFGGFLSQAFRHYDYVLGQCHAQAFLQNQLVLPESNPVFCHWTDEDKQQWQRPSQTYRHSDGHDRTERFLPVLPLVGRDLSRPFELPQRIPGLSSVDVPSLMAAIEARLKALAKRLMPSHLSGLQRLSWAVLQPFIIDALSQRLRGEITRALHSIDAGNP